MVFDIQYVCKGTPKGRREWETWIKMIEENFQRVSTEVMTSLSN